MKTKTIIAAVLAITCTLAFASEETAAVSQKRKGGVPSGGYLELPNTGKVLQVVNLNGACPQRTFDKAVASVGKILHFPFASAVTNVKGKVDANAAARVVVVNVADQPSLLCAPEEYWSVVNIKPLMADSPKDFILQRRLAKQVLRGLGYALGCGNSSVKPCAMSRIDTLTELDGLQLLMGPESLGKTLHTASKRGCQPRKYASYRKACQEGWAPAPTNDVQRAIYEQIKAEQNEKPSNPIRILPGQKPHGR